MGSSKRSTFVSDAAHHEGGRADGWQGAQGSAHGDFADRNDARQHLEAQTIRWQCWRKPFNMKSSPA